jgi:hypothetical protein
LRSASERKGDNPNSRDASFEPSVGQRNPSIEALEATRGIRLRTSLTELACDDVFVSSEEADQFIAFVKASRADDPQRIGT